MRLADAHIHLFAGGYPGKYGAMFPKGGELRAYEAIRRVHHIERALVVGYEGCPWARGNNRYIARLAQKHSWIVPLAFCSSLRRPAAQQFDRWRRMGFRGISLYVSGKSDWESVLAWTDDVFAVLNARQAIISLNIPLPEVARLRPFFARLPGTRILLSHLGMPGRIAEKTSRISARKQLTPLLKQADFPHLGVKLSGFYACNDYPHQGLVPVLEILRRHFGEKRLYWGSDFSPALDAVSFTQTIDAARNSLWNPTQSRDVFHGNLSRAIDRAEALQK